MKRINFIFISLILIMILAAFAYHYNYLPHQKYSSYSFDIEVYTSDKDQDGDGLDDQSDLLYSVKAYLDTKPKYKSVYYATGYPDDGQGVCTDVVAFGMRGAGYDLMELVNQDILENKDRYDIDVVDKNIDFRRVKNLKVYFDAHAQSLTTDISEIDKWQGGDIVIFSNHIGIISDNRNRHGVPFVLHHASPYQLFYEEDILETRNDIVGHYRIRK